MDRFSVALACLRQVEEASVLNLTPDELAFATGQRLWLSTDRALVRRVVEAICYGGLDVVGLPRFPVPAEFVAAAIAYYVHPCNILSACAVMDGVESTVSVLAGIERPLSAHELFAMVIQIRSGDPRRVDKVEDRIVRSIGGRNKSVLDNGEVV